MRILFTLTVSLFLVSSAVRGDDKLSPLAGLWEGTLKVGDIELRLGFKIAAKPDGMLTATMDSIDQGARNIPIDMVAFAEKKLSLELPKLKASYTGTFDGEALTGEWKQGGLVTPLTLKRVDKFSELRRPQTPKKPYPYHEEEVFVQNEAAGIKLAGTLTKPKGPGPFRAAILITGSGPQDRDETIFNHKPFLVLADHLTRHGVAVLRCDDRGVGKSTGTHEPATSVDFASDVRAMVAFMKKRSDIKEVGLIGHSEGGMIAPMVAADNPDVAFIVLLAGPGVVGEELMLAQGQAILAATKADEKWRAWQRDLQTKLFKRIKEGANAKELTTILEDSLKDGPEEIRKLGIEQIVGQSSKLLTSAWLRFFLSYDPSGDLQKVHCPVLALNGAKDTQVLASQNLGGIEKAFKASGNKNVLIKELPDLNHLFQKCETGSPSEYAKIEETIAPVVLDTISDWVNNLK